MDFQFDEKKLNFVQRVLNNRVLFKIVLLFQVPMYEDKGSQKLAVPNARRAHSAYHRDWGLDKKTNFLPFWFYLT